MGRARGKERAYNLDLHGIRLDVPERQKAGDHGSKASEERRISAQRRCRARRAIGDDFPREPSRRDSVGRMAPARLARSRCLLRVSRPDARAFCGERGLGAVRATIFGHNFLQFGPSRAKRFSALGGSMLGSTDRGAKDNLSSLFGIPGTAGKRTTSCAANRLLAS